MLRWVDGLGDKTKGGFYKRMPDKSIMTLDPKTLEYRPKGGDEGIKGTTKALSKVEDVKEAIARPHVSFKVCEISMKNQKVDKSQLLPNVGTVPDGIGEIVAKQQHGWGYIKAVH